MREAPEIPDGRSILIVEQSPLCAGAHTFRAVRVTCKTNMNASLWIALSAAVILALGYLFAMRVLYRQSREVDRHVDFTKIRPLKDEEET
jgi:hypothetical protein